MNPVICSELYRGKKHLYWHATSERSCGGTDENTVEENEVCKSGSVCQWRNFKDKVFSK